VVLNFELKFIPYLVCMFGMPFSSSLVCFSKRGKRFADISRYD